MKKYSDFVKSINEGSGKEFIEVIDDSKPFAGPVDEIHKKDLIDELEQYLEAKESGYIQYVTVSADIKKSGSKKAAYLADVLPVVKRTRTPDPIERAPGDEPDDVNVFVDVEFEVIGIERGTKEVPVYTKEMDPVTGKEKKIQTGTEVVDDSKIIGMPYTQRRKGITTPIYPEDVWEVSFKRTPKKVGS